MSQIFFFLSKTNPKLIKGCSTKAKYTQTSFGVFVLLTGVLAFCSGAYALNMAFEFEGSNTLFAILGGLLYSFIIMAFDREIIGATKKWAVAIRLPLAIMIGAIVSVPIELGMLEGRITEQLSDEKENKNSANAEKRDEGLQRLNDIEADLRHKVTYYEEQIKKWGKIMDEELAGRQVIGRTGKAGPGPVYENAKTQWNDAKTGLEQALADRNDFLEKKPQLIDDINKTYIDETPEKSEDLLARFIALQRLKNGDSGGDPEKHEDARSAQTMSWGIKGLILFIELFPALMKLFREPTDYSHLEDAQTQINMAIIFTKTNARLDEIENNPNTFIKPDAIENMQKQMEIMR